MRNRLFVFVVFVLIPFATILSQELRLVATDKPLNAVLNTLNVEISFDDEALSRYTVTVSDTFKTPEEAIRFLLKDKPFKVEKIGGVYVISPTPPAGDKPKPVIRNTYTVSIELADQSTGEPLPYAYISTYRGIVPANESGYVSFTTSTANPSPVQIQYLGYETLDTVLYAGSHKLELLPRAIELAEVEVAPSPFAMLMQSGNISGEARINHRIARYIPGSADNSVFNLLRMMPGVRASGEPSDDLIVWGSNWGESRLVFDGFTIFGMKSFNDQIGSVNPYMAKDIRLLKGGYDASHGNRVGAIAEITGNEGDFDSASLKANLSNYTANIYVSLPVGKASALSAAYRQTFYNLYDNESVETSTLSDIYIEPEYNFRDLNVKYAGRAFESDHYHISLYGADDRFGFSAQQQDYKVDAAEKNRQYGAAAGYNKVWGNGGNTKFLFSYSRLSAAIDNVLGITNSQSLPLDVFHIKNTVQEISFKLEHNFNIGQRQTIQAGIGWQRYMVSYNGIESALDNPALYITDNISLGKLLLKASVRADFATGDKVYVQPRLSMRYAITEGLAATASFGLYNQFLAKVPYQYGSDSYQMIWNLADSAALSSTHLAAGLAYSSNGWMASIEGYTRKTRNQLYYIDNTIYSLDNTNTGIDFFLKKEWRGQTAFGSYSLVNTINPQKSTGHEVKLGAICSLKAFHFSATYVYGSGFPHLSTGGHGHNNGSKSGGHGQQEHEQQHSGEQGESYSRLDLSLTYTRYLKKFGIQAGISALNVFDTNNVKYSYRLSDQNNVFNIYTKATPFTPVVFIEIIL